MDRVIVLVRFEAKPECVEEIKKELSKLIDPSRNELGCMNFELFQDTANACEFFLYENWQNRALLDQHLDSPHLTGFVMKAEKLLARPLEIRLLNQVM